MQAMWTCKRGYRKATVAGSQGKVQLLGLQPRWINEELRDKQKADVDIAPVYTAVEL